MTSISTPKTGPLTKEYEDGHARVFGEKPDRYCETCGRLPSFCECKYIQTMHFAGHLQLPFRLGNKLIYPDGREEFSPLVEP